MGNRSLKEKERERENDVSQFNCVSLGNETCSESELSLVRLYPTAKKERSMACIIDDFTVSCVEQERTTGVRRGCRNPAREQIIVGRSSPPQETWHRSEQHACSFRLRLHPVEKIIFTTTAIRSIMDSPPIIAARERVSRESRVFCWHSVRLALIVFFSFSCQKRIPKPCSTLSQTSQLSHHSSNHHRSELSLSLSPQNYFLASSVLPTVNRSVIIAREENQRVSRPRNQTHSQ